MKSNFAFEKLKEKLIITKFFSIEFYGSDPINLKTNELK